jgi:hypothetical protein
VDIQAIPFCTPILSRLDAPVDAEPPSSPSAPTHALPRRRSSSHHQHPLRKHLDLSFLPPQTARAEGEDRAQRAVKNAIQQLAVSVRSATGVECTTDEMEVEVDRGGEVKLAGLEDYKHTTSPDLWLKFQALSDHLTSNKISIAFFSATPQGGGVALMRHSLLRLWALQGVDVHWFTPEGTSRGSRLRRLRRPCATLTIASKFPSGHPAIFDITKKRFHNVLQGVNPPGIKLTDKETEMFERWTEANLDTFWSEGAIFEEGRQRVIVVDDPQRQCLAFTASGPGRHADDLGHLRGQSLPLSR